ncbi:MAG: hypothetical protein ACQCN3_10600 [Candidatus Bathyarchaeia archaeon]|jgi:hypothetical protein
MNKKLTVVIFFAMIFLSGNLFVSAQTVASGVVAGDSFSYSISTQWETTNSSLTNPPEYFVNYNQTKYYNITILYVEDVNVVAMNLLEYNNGSQQLSRVDMNIDNGTLYFASGEVYFLGFFPTDLNVADLIRPGDSNSTLRVNSTETWNYADGQREVDVVSFDYQVRDYYNTSVGTESTTYYIDRASGVLVRRVDSAVFSDQSGLLEWNLVDTNLWDLSAPPAVLSFEVIAIVVVVAVVIVLVVAVFVKKHRRGGGH